MGQEQDWPPNSQFVASQRLIGWLDDFQIYGRTLTASEIQKLAGHQPAAVAVDAGHDLLVIQPNAGNLDGKVNGWGTGCPVNASWTEVNGPGTVVFANASAAQTTATFSAPGSYVLQLSASDGTNSANATVNVTVQASSYGIHRYVRVRNASGQYLHLAEVEVFEAVSNRNLATPAGAVASQSSTHHETATDWVILEYPPGNQYVNATADKGIDGNIHQPLNSNSVFHTENGPSEWWMVDLGGTYRIARIKLWNRTYWSQVTSYDANGAPSDLQGLGQGLWGSTQRRRGGGARRDRQRRMDLVADLGQPRMVRSTNLRSPNHRLGMSFGRGLVLVSRRQFPLSLGCCVDATLGHYSPHDDDRDRAGTARMPRTTVAQGTARSALQRRQCRFSFPPSATPMSPIPTPAGSGPA